jgi:PAS domain S-box-containing protein
MRSFLGVPLRNGEQVFGNFYLTEKQGAPEFSEQDARVLESFSEMAALTIGYAREADQQRRMLDAVLHHAPHAILFFRPDGDIAFHNAAARRLLGLRAEPGPRPYQLFTPEGRPIPHEQTPGGKALRGETAENEEVRVRRADGSAVPAFASAAPVRTQSGELAGAVVVFQDITAFKELERMREEFSAVVAHDLRSPLTAMMLSLESQLRVAGGERVEVPTAALQRMHRSGLKLRRLIDDLLDASRIEGERLQLDLKPVSLPSLSAALLKQLERNLDGHATSLRVEGAPRPAQADAFRVEQVLTNLLENAAKYSEPGGPIDVEIREEGEGVQVAVRDRGPGIAPEDLPRLFDRYYQSRRAREKRTGLGLGLYIAKGLIEAQGGRLQARSAPGQGSTFTVWLPVWKEPLSPGEEPRPATAPADRHAP